MLKDELFVVAALCSFSHSIYILIVWFLYSFVQPEILEQLVKLVTLKPDDDAEDKVKFKSVVHTHTHTHTHKPVVDVHVCCNRMAYIYMYRTCAVSVIKLAVTVYAPFTCAYKHACWLHAI